MQAPKPATSAPWASRLAAGLVLLSLLSACGLKGPLYMPEPKAASPAPAKAPATDAGPIGSAAPASANPVK
jgi:predicted small lipoprotein YifL